jgi:succinate dehydrogenase/fumarate reductase-like Fe-S protein
VSPCSASPCLNDGSCTVDVNGEAVCACNGEWSGFYCSGLLTVQDPSFRQGLAEHGLTEIV